MKRLLVLHIIILTTVMTNSMNMQPKSIATFGGGCFWCIEAIFEKLKGVTKVESGYSGGKIANPTYREVCSGLTGHAEVVQIHFDPGIISYKELLTVFFSVHDPTTLNRQGADVGTQYRSVIFYHNEKQKLEAEAFIHKLEEQKIFDGSIVTEVILAEAFYTAEEYHQNYFESNPSQPYCQVVINPKMDKFRKKFKDKLK
jgi:peptide-methionine (S)-S-oxide reductase